MMDWYLDGRDALALLALVVLNAGGWLGALFLVDHATGSTIRYFGAWKGFLRYLQYREPFDRWWKEQGYDDE